MNTTEANMSIMRVMGALFKMEKEEVQGTIGRVENKRWTRLSVAVGRCACERVIGPLQVPSVCLKDTKESMAEEEFQSATWGTDSQLTRIGRSYDDKRTDVQRNELHRRPGSNTIRLSEKDLRETLYGLTRQGRTVGTRPPANWLR